MRDGGRRVPAAAWLAALGLCAASCSGGAAPTTTVTSTTVPPTTTTTLGRISLEPNGEPFLQQGDQGAFVEALQFYLVCTGHERLSPDGPAITVDGSFGPITADAVAYYQAELRRIPSGDPDEETFAQLARDCAEDRSVNFPNRQGMLTVAGNVSQGDEELIALGGVEGRVITIVVMEGEVQASLETSEGTRVQQVTLGGGWSGKLGTDTGYQLRVTAARATSYALDVQVARPRYVNIDFGRMRLAADGLGILTFGDDAEPVIERLQQILGVPAEDSGWATGDAAGRTCVGSNRHLTWVILGTDTGYQLRVTAARATSYALDVQVARPRYVNIDFGRMRLAADGLGILTFGDDAEPVIERLQQILGAPAEDSGWATGDAAGRTCVGSNRHLAWVIQPADSGDAHPAVLHVHLGEDETGKQAFAEYAYFSLDPQAVDAGALDLSTEAGISIGRTIAEFVAAYGQPDFVDGSSGIAEAAGMRVGIAQAGGEDLVWFVGSGADGCEGYE